MSFVRQRDIIQQERRVAELQLELKKVQCLSNREALAEAKETLKDMKQRVKKYNVLFKK